MTSLRLKRVLITGAARGLGREIAQRFAAEGSELVLTDIDQDLLAETREELTALGCRCRAYRLDVTDTGEILEVRDRLHREAGRVDILVNNAGVVFGGPFLEVPLERHRATYRVNVDGVVAVTHAFLPDLIASPRGSLVCIASASGFVGLPNGSTYASSKWAVIGFAESIRAELRHQGHRHVQVTTVCPTYIDTGMFSGAKPPKATAMLQPEEIATKVVEAVKQNKIWVLEPWIVKLTPLLKNALPTRIADFLTDALGASRSMDGWTGRQAGAQESSAADAAERRKSA